MMLINIGLFVFSIYSHTITSQRSSATMSQYLYHRNTFDYSNLSTVLCCSTIDSDLSKYSYITVHVLPASNDTTTYRPIITTTEADTVHSLRLKQLKLKFKLKTASSEQKEKTALHEQKYKQKYKLKKSQVHYFREINALEVGLVVDGRCRSDGD